MRLRYAGHRSLGTLRQPHACACLSLPTVQETPRVMQEKLTADVQHAGQGQLPLCEPTYETANGSEDRPNTRSDSAQ